MNIHTTEEKNKKKPKKPSVGIKELYQMQNNYKRDSSKETTLSTPCLANVSVTPLEPDIENYKSNFYRPKVMILSHSFVLLESLWTLNLYWE